MTKPPTKNIRTEIEPARYEFIVARMKKHNINVYDFIISALIYHFAEKGVSIPEGLVRSGKPFRKLKSEVHHPDDKNANVTRDGKKYFGTDYDAELVNLINEKLQETKYSYQMVVDNYIDIIVSNFPDWDDDLTVEALTGITYLMDINYVRSKLEKADMARLYYEFHQEKKMPLEDFKKERIAIEEKYISLRKPLPEENEKPVSKQKPALKIEKPKIIGPITWRIQ